MCVDSVPKVTVYIAGLHNPPWSMKLFTSLIWHHQAITLTYTHWFSPPLSYYSTHTCKDGSSVWMLGIKSSQFEFELSSSIIKWQIQIITSKGILLNLTLAHAAALLPGARQVPHKLLLVIRYRNVKGITYIRAIQVPYTQHLKGKTTN